MTSLALGLGHVSGFCHPTRAYPGVPPQHLAEHASLDLFHGNGVAAIDGMTVPDLNAYQGGSIITNGNAVSSISAAGTTASFSYSNTGGGPSLDALPNSIHAQLGRPLSLPLLATGGSDALRFSEYRTASGYSTLDEGVSLFDANSRRSQNWRSDDRSWLLSLPFEFPYYETSYHRVWVDSNGYLSFADGDSEHYHNEAYLNAATRLAPMRADLATHGGGEDIFIDTTVTDQLTIRWKAHEVNSGNPCNFAVVLQSDGTIHFDHGSGNQAVIPTIGISRGHSGASSIPASHSGQADLAAASSLTFRLTGSRVPPGLKLDGSGNLSGTPTLLGDFDLRVQGKDQNHLIDRQDVRLRILPKRLEGGRRC